MLVAAVVPPLATEAGRAVWAETLQFVLLALGAPALFVVGAAFDDRRGWHLLGRTGVARLCALDQARRRHPSLVRALAFVVVDAGMIVAWRVPATVDALERHRWLLAVEAVALVVAGVGLWLELVASPPLSPRVARPWHAVLAAVSMWVIWVSSFVIGFSHVPWYRAIDHAGISLSAVADQEIAAGILWFSAACAFVPVVFGDIVAWLKEGDDPDAELRRLLRSERRSGSGPDRRAGGSAA